MEQGRHLYNKLEQLALLYQKGLITEKEYSVMKQEILNPTAPLVSSSPNKIVIVVLGIVLIVASLILQFIIDFGSSL